MVKSTQKKSRSTRLQRSLSILKKQMPELTREYNVKSLGIFGSYARGTQLTRLSDIDILVEFNKPPDLFQFMEIEEYLAKQLGVKVDLVPRRALKGEIGERIPSEVEVV